MLEYFIFFFFNSGNKSAFCKIKNVQINDDGVYKAAPVFAGSANNSRNSVLEIFLIVEAAEGCSLSYYNIIPPIVKLEVIFSVLLLHCLIYDGRETDKK